MQVLAKHFPEVVGKLQTKIKKHSSVLNHKFNFGVSKIAHSAHSTLFYFERIFHLSLHTSVCAETLALIHSDAAIETIASVKLFRLGYLIYSWSSAENTF